MSEPTYEEICQEIADLAGEGTFADGLEDALIGYVERYGMEPVALYDREKCIEIVMTRGGTTREEAEEHFDFNIVGAYMGTSTPAFAVIRRSARA